VIRHIRANKNSLTIRHLSGASLSAVVDKSL